MFFEPEIIPTKEQAADYENLTRSEAINQYMEDEGLNTESIDDRWEAIKEIDPEAENSCLGWLEAVFGIDEDR